MNVNMIINLREDNDLTQTKIAKILGIKQQTYSLWETKSKIIPLKHINNLCNYYDVSMDYLLSLSNKKIYKNNIVLNNLDRKLIGQNITLIRKSNNLSLRKLAKELNTTPSTISAYEHGKTLILTAFAYQICKKYNVSLDWLCGKIK